MSTTPAARPGAAAPAPPERSGDATVTFRMFASARAAAGTGEVQVEPGPTAQVVAALAACAPAAFADVLAVSSLVADGTRLDRTSPTALPAGTIVDVLPPFAGG